MWLYAENDDYFGPMLSQRMVEAFRNAGGRAEFYLLPALDGPGHLLINSTEAFALWVPILAKFLAGQP